MLRSPAFLPYRAVRMMRGGTPKTKGFRLCDVDILYMGAFSQKILILREGVLGPRWRTFNRLLGKNLLTTYVDAFHPPTPPPSMHRPEVRPFRIFSLPFACSICQVLYSCILDYWISLSFSSDIPNFYPSKLFTVYDILNPSSLPLLRYSNLFPLLHRTTSSLDRGGRFATYSPLVTNYQN